MLVGYSGGGTLAVLTAPRLQGVQAVVTVAANLDIHAWTAHHGYLPLTQSLNPTDMAERTPWPQIHLRGDHDEVVPEATLTRYFATHPFDVEWRYPRNDHVCCWREQWPEIVERLRREFPQSFATTASP